MMLKNIQLYLMGHNEEAGATQLIPVTNTNLLHNALVHVAEEPPARALQIHGDRQEVALSPERLLGLMPTEPVDLATTLGAPKEVIHAMQTGKTLVNMLQAHAGEAGEDEGAIETLSRILEGHRAAIATKDNQAPEPTRYPMWLYRIGADGKLDRQTIDDEDELKSAVNEGWCGSEEAAKEAAKGGAANAAVAQKGESGE